MFQIPGCAFGFMVIPTGIFSLPESLSNLTRKPARNPTLPRPARFKEDEVTISLKEEDEVEETPSIFFFLLEKNQNLIKCVQSVDCEAFQAGGASH